MARTVNSETIELIKEFEGCRLEAYKCPAGVWTIGYGHTAGVRQGMKITQAQAEEYLKEDLKKYSAYVDKYVTIFTPNNNQYGALTSFCYNCGAGNLKTLVTGRSASEIAAKLPAYNKAGGKALAGLTRRREAEKKLFLKETVTGTTESSEDYKMRTIKKGSSGRAVKIWQIIIGAVADGFFGNDTEEATKAWQKSNGLTADGIVGKKSWTRGLECIFE